MTPEELADFTAKLKAETLASEAYFGIFQYGGGPDESFIRANKQGLQLFAAELLEAANRVDETLAHDPTPLAAPAEPATLADTLEGYAWIGVGFLLIIALAVGIGNGIKTITEWLFG